MNVVIWARVSSREQKEGYSIDAQLRATRERALKNGWTAVREFAVAESAKRGAERAVFNEMFKWVKANAKRDKIKAILSHKLDRVCRNMRDAVRLQELEDVCGVQLAFVENQFGPGAAGAFSFNVMAAVAQYYSDNLRSEVLKGMDEKVRQGWPTGHAPFGYINVDDKDEPIQPHPEKSRAVVRIFELYSTGNYTFKGLADELTRGGFTYRPSEPRFRRTTLSYILNNRFYVGELIRNGRTYPGKYRLLISRQIFDTCQDILNGRNRRMTNHMHLFSGGLIRCAHCGFAMTGELIRRKINGGGVREHVYYRCANNEADNGHSTTRWREDNLEQAIVDDLATLRMPSQEIAQWFRASVQAAFADIDELHRRQKQVFLKRKTELANMQERLLNGFLSGAIEEEVFQAKSAGLKQEVAQVDESLEQAQNYDPDAPVRALAVFDFSQNLVSLWQRSNSAQKREILDCVSLNRAVDSVSLCLTKRKPFDFLAERPFLKESRGDWRNFEPKSGVVAPVVSMFLQQPPQYLIMADSIIRKSA